jgi:hypothetical protein
MDKPVLETALSGHGLRLGDELAAFAAAKKAKNARQ